MLDSFPFDFAFAFAFVLGDAFAFAAAAAALEPEREPGFLDTAFGFTAAFEAAFAFAAHFAVGIVGMPVFFGAGLHSCRECKRHAAHAMKTNTYNVAYEQVFNVHSSFQANEVLI